MKKVQTNIFLNFAIAADVTIGAVLATVPCWYTQMSSTTVFYYSVGGCAALFAALTVGRWAAHRISLNRRRPKIKYYRGRNYEGCRLGYISPETICAALRENKIRR